MQVKRAGIIYQRASGVFWTIRRRRIFAHREGLKSEITELATRIDGVLRGRELPGNRPWLVTSTLHTGSAALSYSSTRSVFSFEDRLNQTRETLASIAEATPAAPVVLLDLSLTSSDRLDLRNDLNTCLLPDTQGLDVLRDLARGPYKGLAEAMLLLAASETKTLSLSGFWKISGRYRLTGDALVRSIPQPGGITGVVRDDAINTTCFSVSASAIAELKVALWQSMPAQLVGRSFESSLYRQLRDSGRVNAVPTIGVSGLIAVSGERFTA